MEIMDLDGNSSYDRDEVKKLYPGFGDEYILIPGENGGVIRGYMKEPSLTRSWGVEETDMEKNMFFVYYNRKNPAGVKFHNFSELLHHFEEKKDVKLITHGWMSSSNADYAVEMKDAYLNKSDVNVIIMDWNIVAGSVFYPSVMLVTPRVSAYLATFLNFLVDNLHVDPKHMHLIGHSLGAHVAGFAGRQVRKGKLGRITALDPALPGFIPMPIYGDVLKEKRLSANDSEFVDVIHTCAGFLGFKDPIGHADFYPNGGGPPQPGCGVLKFIEACSHGRSWKLFVNTIRSDVPFIASECSSFDYLEYGTCSGNEIPMGEKTPATARGLYYIETTGTAPYISILQRIHDFFKGNV